MDTTSTSTIDEKDESFFKDFAFRQIEYGGFWRRTGANLIDVFIFAPIGFLGIYLIAQGSMWEFIVYQIVVGLLREVYTTTMHALFGATLGKMATGLVVRRIELTKIGWAEAIQRSFVDYLFAVINIVGSITTINAISMDQISHASFIELGQMIRANQSIFFTINQYLITIWFWSEVIILLFNKKRMALHDFIADTVVVKKKSLISIISKVAG